MLHLGRYKGATKRQYSDLTSDFNLLMFRKRAGILTCINICPPFADVKEQNEYNWEKSQRFKLTSNNQITASI